MMIRLMRRQTAVLGALLLVVALTGTAAAGYITVAEKGRYFEKDGEPFLIVGLNDSYVWPGLSPLVGRISPGAAEDYIKRLVDSGVNTVRVMIEYAQYPHNLLEDPLGEYNEDVVRFWDDFFALTEKYDLYVIATPWDPFFMERTWDSNPYNVENGGFMRSMIGFLTDEEAIEAQKRRWRFILERWGDSEQILAWELINEVELWWGASGPEIYDWIGMMADYIRQTERELYGKTHLLTVSTADPMPSGTLARAIYNHPKLDFATTHLYTGPGMNAPMNTTDVVAEVDLAVNYSLWQIQDRRPYIDTESGPIEMWIGSPKMDAEFLHNVSFAHLFSGGAGTGMRWPYRSPHILTDEMLAALGRVRKFIDANDWHGYSPDNISGDVEVGEGIQACAISDGNKVLVWLVREEDVREGPQSEEFSVYYLDDAHYRVRFWDTWKCQWIEETELIADEETVFTTPAFAKDIAIVIEKTDAK